MVVIDNNNIYNNTTTTNPIFISNSGNVGIGSLTPTANLDVTGSINCSNGLTVAAGTVSFPSGSITSSSISGTLSQWSTGSGSINYTGKVGINNSGPTYSLDVTGNTRITGNTNNVSGTGGNTVSIGSTTTNATSLYILGTTAASGASTGNAIIGIAGGAAAANYSTHAAGGDFVISTSGNLVLQNGSTTSALFIGSSTYANKVGIGNSVPSVALDVTGNIKCSTGLTVTAGGLTVSAGNVGINTSISASYALDVYHGASTNAQTRFSSSTTSTECAISLNNTATTNGAEFWIGSSASTTVASGSTGAGTKTFYIYDKTNTAVRMVINTSGNVGIGTTNPGYALDLCNTTSSGNAPFIRLGAGGTAGNTTGIIFNPLYSRTGGAAAQIWGIDNGNSSAHLAFGTAPTGASTTLAERMRILDSGNVGINNTGPSGKFAINSNVSDSNSFDFSTAPATITHPTPTTSALLNDSLPVLHLCRQGTSGQAYGCRASFHLSRYENNGTNSRTRLDVVLANAMFDSATIITVLSNGNVGINQTVPAYPLDVTGAIRATGDITAFSDKRVKTNLEIIEKPIEILEKISGYYYIRTDTEDKKRCIGVIAQELLEVLPEVVSQDNDGFYSVAYGNLTALLIEALKEEVRLRKALGEEVKDLKRNLRFLLESSLTREPLVSYDIAALLDKYLPKT